MNEEAVMLPKPICPCQDCKERTSDCHGNCERFIAYTDAYKEWTAAIRHRRHMQGIGYTGPVSKTKMAQIDRKKGRL